MLRASRSPRAHALSDKCGTGSRKDRSPKSQLGSRPPNAESTRGKPHLEHFEIDLFLARRFSAEITPISAQSYGIGAALRGSRTRKATLTVVEPELTFGDVDLVRRKLDLSGRKLRLRLAKVHL